MRRVMVVAAPLALALLAGCETGPVDPELAARQCEERAQAAQGPTGSVSLGVNSESGPQAGVAIGLSGDFLAGRDPQAVYEECVIAKTGAMPIRPPRLR